MKKILIFTGCGLAALLLLVFGLVLLGLMYIGINGPETSIYHGKQVPSKYLSELKTLGLLSENETMRYFYSDALLDIKEGLYFVTDQNLVLYKKSWEPCAITIPLKNITKIEVIYDNSFLEDSTLYIEAASDVEVHFPLSNEHGTDKKFVRYLSDKSGIQATESLSTD